ncbi:MAG: PfkB family carbohydrate kinase [Candidatus Omnitrophica bacterium]|jgi:sugar/nucleoside kinase (ribokinase family)|nr:PfkB family carbohydrate kinase [Candidatus Omnitrophota bacterium]
MSILVLGTVALDSVKTPFGHKKQMLGGSAAHFSMAARLFTKVHLVAIIGKDFPKKYIDFLRGKNLELSSLITDIGKTFRWQGQYQGDLNTAITLSTELGVLSGFKPRISKEQSRISHIFLANVDPDIQRHLLKKMSSPRLVGLDSMNYWINHKRASLVRLLKDVDIYVANDQEARMLSGESNLIKAARACLSFGAKMVLIKKGEHGVLFFNDKLTFSLPAYLAERVVDPTGAGDTFAGGFMGYLAKSKKITPQAIKKALAYGTIAASFNIEDFGLRRTAVLTKEELERRITDFKKRVLF